MSKPARHRLHRELREIVQDADATLSSLELVRDKFSDQAYTLTQLAVYLEAHRRLTHIVDRLEAGR